MTRDDIPELTMEQAAFVVDRMQALDELAGITRDVDAIAARFAADHTSCIIDLRRRVTAARQRFIGEVYIVLEGATIEHLQRDLLSPRAS